jgi:uncharacterized protein
MGYWPLSIKWVARHQGYVEGRQFQDIQERGPFHSWEHTHTVTPLNDWTCLLRDHIEYELPFGNLGKSFVSRRLIATFVYRHHVTTLQTT